MRFKTGSVKSNGVNVVKVVGNMNAREAEDLKEYMFGCLDNGSYVHLINCTHLKKIDGFGIDTICYFVNRGMHIGLFNVCAEVRTILKLSGKGDFIYVINENKIDKIVSLFKNKILEKKDSKIDRKKRRLHTRINTSSPAKFKRCNESDEIVQFTANILNISEGGVQANQIVICNTEARENGDKPYINKSNLHEIEFGLNGDFEIIKTSGVCVWESDSSNNLSAGIHFKEMSRESKSRILKYINNSI